MGLSPAVARKLVGAFLRVASPFNSPLRADVQVWEPGLCRIRVPNRRPLHNHLRGIHACALATAGETPAGLLLLRTFPFSRYRLILKDLSIHYERQARTALVAEADLHADERQRIEAGLAAGDAQLVTLETRIDEPAGPRLATVRTTWQVKAWDQVRSRA
ncbi:MAG: DUF4442 domain-containing protein [Myxococcales bacterium]